MRRTKEILTAVGTLACAVGIGFVMQSSDTAEQRYGKAENQRPVASNGALLEVEGITLTSATLDSEIALPLPDAQVTKAAAPQGLPPAPESHGAAITAACDIIADAQAVAAAMVKLALDAACLPNERLTVHHNGMIFTEVTDDKGRLNVTVPALAEEAVFILAFGNGDGAVAQTTVPELSDFNRVVLQWKGAAGFELHAREFGADYGDAGHVWSGAPRDMATAVLGEGGFMIRNGDTDAAEPLMAEIYSFPVAAAAQEGDVALSVEAEVSKSNCGLEIEAQALELRGADQVKTQNLTLAVPDCDAVGNFLVLNNLLQDLKVAQN
ncbi:hypothetical protein DSM110093_00024 [Sulfitobacter sp. DSM 110093]|uniref:hypothetical protein n=1 Tax=Sulfitobacter sp. DSM 110093 TaxID=2883127 RepID=UPI001FAE6D1D|nr:hypothetical protein [Sulfitobacter sp. DSM 110093]UOA30281.1 hypothetical protein DSM110093_00024 [Sulfitobacter sp. DSM 110093]